MPIPREAQILLDHLRPALGEYQLVGLLINPVTGELGVVSSESYEPGAAIGFIQNGVALLAAAMSDGTLEVVDGPDERRAEQAEARGNVVAIRGEYVN